MCEIQKRHSIDDEVCGTDVISDGSNTRMGSQFTPEEYYYAWKKVENTDPNGRIGIDEMLMLIQGALTPKGFLRYCATTYILLMKP